MAPFTSPEVRPADPADVEHRQRRQADRSGVETPTRRRSGTPPRGCAASSARPSEGRWFRTCTSAPRCRPPRRGGRGPSGDGVARRCSYSSPVSSTSRCCGNAAGDPPCDVAIGRARDASPLAPASATIVSSSAGASRQFSGTVTAPILLAANSSSTTSGAVRSRCATAIPGADAGARAAPGPAGSSARRARRSVSAARTVADRDDVGPLRRMARGHVRDPRVRRSNRALRSIQCTADVRPRTSASRTRLGSRAREERADLPRPPPAPRSDTDAPRPRGSVSRRPAPARRSCARWRPG